MRTCCLLLLLLGWLPVARAQPADPRPAWRRALAAARTDSARGRLSYWLSGYAVTIDSERYFAQRSVTYNQRALRTARGYPRQQVLGSLAGALHALGTASASAGDRPTAIRYLRRAIQLEQQTGDTLTSTLSLSNLGGVYTNERRYLLALQTLQQSISLAERTPGASRKLSVYLSRMGRLQEFLGNDSAALRYHLRAVGRLRHPTDLNDWDDLILCLGNLSDTYLNAFDDTTRAERSIRQARALVGQSDALSYRLAEVLFRQGAIRRREGRWVAARVLLLAAQARARATNNQLTLARIQANLALVEENSGHLPLALRYALQSVSYGQRNILADKSLAADIVARLYEKLDRPREALAALHRAQALRDSASNDADKRRALGQLLRTDYQRRTQALRAAQAAAAAELRRQRWLLGGLLAGAGLLALLAAQQWRHRHRQQQANTLLATQKAQLQEQASRLGELDEAKNQFFANVSHELRTPLTLILGPLDGLLTAPPRPLPPAVRQPVELAYRHAQRLRELVNRILELTRLQAGRLGLHPVPTDVSALLRRVVGQFESLAGQRGITLAGPAGLPPALPLLLDADKVEQVLTNLLINALNHTPPGGVVLVAAQLPAPDGQYAVSVQDTGPGIAAAEQARVFERYYQSPQGQAQGGTGLGLALSHELAQLLGGTLTLASPPGQGATFTLRFPAKEAAVELGSRKYELEVEAVGAAPAPDATKEATPNSQFLIHNSSKPRVLVVEDQPDLRDYLRQLLAPTCEVLTAADGQAALDLLATGPPPDLVATDAMMPRLSGTELLAHLRADPARAGVPVLMLTARADDAHRQHALAIGVDDYLTKPFVPAELLARVRALLRHHEARQRYAALPPEAEETAPDVAATAADAPISPAGDPAGPAPGPAAAEQLSRWQARVASQLADPAFGPDELAAHLLLSRRTLYRRLGELTGLTPAAWLRELRLHHARQLLEAGRYDSLAAVAEAAGFASAKYFSTLYTERFGRRPSDYGNG